MYSQFTLTLLKVLLWCDLVVTVALLHPQGHYAYGASCYAFHEAPAATWEDAKNACSLIHPSAHLVVVNDRSTIGLESY